MIQRQVQTMIWVLQAILSKADENHLGVALKQPGGSRYEQMKVADVKEICLQKGWNRVSYVPCNFNCKGLFMCQRAVCTFV